MDYLKETPSQTAGPYVHIGLAPAAAGFDIYDRELGFDPVPEDVPGERITVTGRVIDAEARSTADGFVPRIAQAPRSAAGEESFELRRAAREANVLRWMLYDAEGRRLDQHPLAGADHRVGAAHQRLAVRGGGGQGGGAGECGDLGLPRARE